jgi:hypothetical protein
MNTMKRVLMLMMFALLVSNTFAVKLKTTGVTITTSGQLKPFTQLDVNDVFNVELTSGENYSYTMTSDEVYKDNVMFVVEGNELSISLKRGVSIKDNSAPKIVITIPSADIAKECEVEISGASSFKMEDFKINTFILDVSGASVATVKRVEFVTLEIDLSGTAKVDIAGYADKCDIDVSGVSALNARDLDMKRGNIDMSGVSTVKIGKVSDELDADVSGVSQLGYSGNPKKSNIKTSGVSNVEMY